MTDFLNKYTNPALVAAEIEAGNHRQFVGGLWEQIGRHQFDFLRDNGLTPDQKVLDVGCGCLRVGVHLVEYLDPENYYGIDQSKALLDAGFDVELPMVRLQHKLPRANLACNAGFDATMFDVQFDVAFAQSVFTHLPINHLKLALCRLATVVSPGGVFYATIFLTPEAHPWVEPLFHPALGRSSFAAKDPFHYSADDVRHCASGPFWTCEIIGDWGHARGQSMVKFVRRSD